MLAALTLASLPLLALYLLLQRQFINSLTGISR
jgi:ABC-type glycerol-3-phosphate transport system permease component